MEKTIAETLKEDKVLTPNIKDAGTEKAIPENIDERIKLYEREAKNLLNKYKLSYQVGLEFPEYRIIPDEIQLALLLISKQKHQFVFQYEDLTEKK